MSLKKGAFGSIAHTLPGVWFSLLFKFQLSGLMAVAARQAVPPLRGYYYIVVYRARSNRLGSSFLRIPHHFRLHFPFSELGADDIARLHLGG